ncbi:(deoxy)nucleoside triphosphate pyrophosphohydrolase [Bdellovibrio sp. HCB2-146]|uniref:(deoxy)nucleoside triphosphate pyrophosphohydrolase n=1 Tax=Bdellovibrio sp. HCB2-146 TaxID=3394362 RepID=UPI0039BCAFAB
MNLTPIPVVAAVIFRSHEPGKILIVRRGPDQSGAGHWEFPGGKIEVGEAPEQALLREIEEELGIRIRVRNFIGEEVHHYPTKSIRLKVYWAETSDEELQLTEHDAFKWLEPDQIPVQDLSAADRPFVEKIRQGRR